MNARATCMSNTSRYVQWFEQHGARPVLRPNMVPVEAATGDLEIVRGGLRGILPYLRAYWKQTVPLLVQRQSQVETLEQLVTWGQVQRLRFGLLPWDNLDAVLHGTLTMLGLSPDQVDFVRFDCLADLAESFRAGQTDIVERRSRGISDVPALRDATRLTIDTRPPWEPELWLPLGDRDAGWIRFLDADQALNMLSWRRSPREEPRAFRAQVREVLESWFVAIEASLIDRPEILSRRVETIRVSVRTDRQHRPRFVWSRSLMGFPDMLRGHIMAGLDPVHTPEGVRAGLVRYLCEGWSIGPDGHLVAGPSASSWGPSTATIPFPRHNAPRRLMLGASLQSRAVRLAEEEPPPPVQQDEASRSPGRRLFAAFSVFGGWTHEDAVVLSESASAKLTCRKSEKVDLLIPSVANRIVTVAPGKLTRGTVLVQAFVDLFAMGYRKHQAEELGAQEGWLEICIPGSELRDDAVLLDVTRQRTPASCRWRELITLHFENRLPVRIGDKLATRHGIKGVVSRILADQQMPVVNGGHADVVLSPVGIAKRGAFGQFREATSGENLAQLPHGGTIFVMRQPQDAGHPDRYRMRGPKTAPARVRGQRYGEMEYWALMAHGATAIATELLSLDRSTARWMEIEAQIGAASSREAATQALNRYLAIVGARLVHGQLRTAKDEQGRLWVEPHEGAFQIDIPKSGSFDQAMDMLEDENSFKLCSLGVILLDEPVPVKFRVGKDRDYEIVFRCMHVIPPWLRPKIRGVDHKLTAAYKWLLKCLAWQKQGQNHQRLPGIIRTCVRFALGDRVGGECTSGLDVFLRREVLGRRLTRSARAVIVPDPNLRIDQIGIPRQVADVIFDGLGERQRHVVLVNRNPTLQRRGLLAMRPVIVADSDAVFRLPLGVLKTLAADFDGDQASVVALESEAAIQEAEDLLLPGSRDLRSDPFRPGEPAFPLLKELSVIDAERELAADTTCSQDAWCDKHQELVTRRLAEIGDGWGASIRDSIADLPEELRQLWDGLDEAAWLERAAQEMETIYTSVRKKGRYGGVLRQQFYRRKFVNAESFRLSVEAIHAVTEPLVQSALSCKSGAGAFHFPINKFFEDPTGERTALKSIAPVKDQDGNVTDSQFDEDHLCRSLGELAEPRGLLKWLAKPTFEGLLGVLQEPTEPPCPEADPRISWFLG